MVDLNGSSNWKGRYRKTISKIVSGFVCVTFAITVGVACFCLYQMSKPSSYISQGNIILKKCNEDQVCNLMENLRISDHRIVSKFAVILSQLGGNVIKSGEYWLPDGVSVKTCLRIFSSGCSVRQKFTIPEGFSVAQVIEKLKKDDRLLGEIEEIPDEGTLMPDTYVFSYPTTKQHIISMSQTEMKKFLLKSWRKRPKDCYFDNIKDVLILASIVEKETYVERRKVACVYINRLKRRMRLQACPTAIYAITKGKPLGRRLLYSDLDRQLPHNTYRNAGLPPTPICNPSRESILAVLNPERSDYLFFMYENGKGYFSRTFEEHKRNVRKRNAMRRRSH